MWIDISWLFDFYGWVLFFCFCSYITFQPIMHRVSKYICECHTSTDYL